MSVNTDFRCTICARRGQRRAFRLAGSTHHVADFTVQGPRWRVRVLATGITLAAFLALFVGFEYAYRYLVIGSLRLEPFTWADDPDLLYRLNPSNPQFPSSFRGKAPDATKDGHVLVICMGGSTTFGFRVSAEEAWPHVMEDLLRANGMPVEVINAGVDGYGSNGHDRRRLWCRRLGAPGGRDRLPRSGDRRPRVRAPGSGEGSRTGTRGSLHRSLRDPPTRRGHAGPAQRQWPDLPESSLPRRVP